MIKENNGNEIEILTTYGNYVLHVNDTNVK